MLFRKIINNNVMEENFKSIPGFVGIRQQGHSGRLWLNVSQIEQWRESGAFIKISMNGNRTNQWDWDAIGTEEQFIKALSEAQA